MYQFRKIDIGDIDNYQYALGDIHYKYKNYDFLYKHNRKKNLVVFFHGAFSERIGEGFAFRGYDYEYENADILSLSDILIKLNKNKKLQLSWYLSTPKLDTISIYIKIIKSVLIKNNYDKVIFTGSSGGGFPSLLFSSIFNGYCIISNSQIYLDKYPYFDKMLSLLELNKDDIDYDIEKHILKYGSPNKIYLYTNISDKHHYNFHSIPFNNFMIKHYPDHIKTIFFEGIKPPLGKGAHHVQYPGTEIYYDVIKNILNN